MSRTTMAIVSGVILLGCIVAWLPAQESSRRTASKYKPFPPGGPAADRPEPTPPTLPGGSLPVGNAPSSMSADSASRISTGIRSTYSPTGQQWTSPAEPSQLPPGEPAALDAAAGHEPSISGDGALGSELDDSQLHSVLKRRSAVAGPELPAMPPVAPPSAASTPSAGDLPRRTPGVSSPPPTFPSSSSAASGGSAASRSVQNMAVGGKSAALKVEITGPQGITVGKPSPYVITLSNESDVAAEEAQLRVALPSWVSVQATQPSNGDASFQGDAQGMGRLVWNIARVPAKARETLKLQLVTREGDTFDLSAEWACKPAVTRTAIVVKQPQLALSLTGPADMIFGEEKTFTLSVSNPGSGDAEHVVVSVAAGNSPPQQFDAGTVPAGHKKEVPLAVVASQAGTIELTISAAAESGLEARTSGKINVKKAEVSLAIEGPPLKYAGTEATYLVTVANGGTAAADNINLSLSMPPGAKYVGGIDGATANASGLKWKIGSLAPGGERVYEVRLQLSTAGLNRVVVQSQATASGTANSAAETEVEAVSDLKLVVNDPSGPLPTGEQAVYELQVMNRGSQAARQVKIIVQFSEGVEPVAFEGCEARIVPGQVLCQPLAQLGPGEQATLRVKAKAQQAGTHHFRVEVTTTDGDARLVSEGTTRFFSEGGRGVPAASTARKPSLLPSPSIPTTLR